MSQQSTDLSLKPSQISQYSSLPIQTPTKNTDQFTINYSQNIPNSDGPVSSRYFLQSCEFKKLFSEPQNSDYNKMPKFQNYSDNIKFSNFSTYSIGQQLKYDTDEEIQLPKEQKQVLQQNQDILKEITEINQNCALSQKNMIQNKINQFSTNNNNNLIENFNNLGKPLGNLQSKDKNQQDNNINIIEKNMIKEKFDKLEKFCMCDAQKSFKPTRSIVFSEFPKVDKDDLLEECQQYGDIMNIDQHFYQEKNQIIVTFYNLIKAMQVQENIQKMYSQSNIYFLKDLDNCDFADFLILQNQSNFQENLILQYFSQYGQILEYQKQNSNKMIIRFQDLRVIKQIKQQKNLLDNDKKDFLQQISTLYPGISEYFIVNVLQHIIFPINSQIPSDNLENSQVLKIQQQGFQNNIQQNNNFVSFNQQQNYLQNFNKFQQIQQQQQFNNCLLNPLHQQQQIYQQQQQQQFVPLKSILSLDNQYQQQIFQNANMNANNDIYAQQCQQTLNQFNQNVNKVNQQQENNKNTLNIIDLLPKFENIQIKETKNEQQQIQENNILQSKIIDNNNKNNDNENKNLKENQQIKSENDEEIEDKENCNPNFQNAQKYENNENKTKQKKQIKLNLNSRAFDIQEQEENQNKQILGQIFRKQENQNDNENQNQNQVQQVEVIESIYNKSQMPFYQDFQIKIDNINQGLDQRSTIMIKNIPNRYLQHDMVKFIDVKFQGTYDFFYLPMDFKNKCNIGYAFLNFIDFKKIPDFIQEFNNKRWDLVRSEKICQISYAKIQGQQNLIEHFKRSGVMAAAVDVSFQPLVWLKYQSQSQNYQFQQQQGFQKCL